MTYKTAIILAYELNKEKNGKYVLSLSTKRRTDLGIDLLKKGDVETLIMSADCSHRYEGLSLAEAMREYALSHGVEDKRIIKEEASLDTVGQLVFCKLGILKPRNWTQVIIVSDKWHIPRVQKIGGFVFPDYKVKYISASNETKQEEKNLGEEEGSLNKFQNTFLGVAPGDDSAILERLLEKHELYNKTPDIFRRKLILLKQRNESRN